MRMRFTVKPLTKIITNRRFIAAALAVVCLAGVYLFVSARAARHVGAAYAAYAKLADAQEQAAYLPAAPNNPVRQQLNLVLSEALQSSVSSATRLHDSQQGLVLLDELDSQVDAIGSTSAKANASLAEMQVSFPAAFMAPGAVRQLIDLGKQRSALIEDIRGLSYRADFETRKIFNRIIADKGALTPSHISDLNNEIPQVEAEYDRRTSLYSQLQDVSARIRQKAAALGPGFSGASASP